MPVKQSRESSRERSQSLFLGVMHIHTVNSVPYYCSRCHKSPGRTHPNVEVDKHCTDVLSHDSTNFGVNAEMVYETDDISASPGASGICVVNTFVFCGVKG
jgi:hypothetical protein